MPLGCTGGINVTELILLLGVFQSSFGMTPVQFQQQRDELLTLSLQVRQARQLDTLDRVDPGSVRSWMRRPFLTTV